LGIVIILDNGAGGNHYDYTNLKNTLDLKILPSGMIPIMGMCMMPRELAGDNYAGGSPKYGNVYNPTSMNDWHNYMENVIDQMESYVSDYNTAHSTSHSVNDWHWRVGTEVNNPNIWYKEVTCDYYDWTGPGDWDDAYVDNDNRDSWLSNYVQALNAANDALGSNNVEMFSPGHVQFNNHLWGDYIVEYCYDNSKRMDSFMRTRYWSIPSSSITDTYDTLDTNLDHRNR
jgi:hypothetical protein